MPGRTSSFEVTAQYTPDSNIPEGFDRALGRFTVKAPSCSGGDRLKLKLKLRLNLNGCAGLEEVQNAVEEEYEDKVPRPAKVGPFRSMYVISYMMWDRTQSAWTLGPEPTSRLLPGLEEV